MDLQCSSIMDLQISFERLDLLLKEIKLNINDTKSELLTTDGEESITLGNGERLYPSNQAKYLGQYITADGVCQVTLNSSFFGKIIGLLSSNKELSRASKVKIFKIYMKSKFTHLIPLLLTSGSISNVWKEIRRVIFHHILDKATLPLESCALMRISYYSVIIRPVLTLHESLLELKRMEEANFLKMAIIKGLSQWTMCEENNTVKTLEVIGKIQAGNIWLKKEDLDEVINTEAVRRILRFREDEALINKLKGVKLPNLILKLSNANYHEVEQRLRNIAKTKEERQKKEEESRIAEIVRDFIVVTNYALSYKTKLHCLYSDSKNLEERISHYSVSEAIISVRVDEIISQMREKIEGTVSTLILDNTNICENNELVINRLIILQEDLRKSIAENREVDRELEMVLDLLRGIREESTHAKKKVGRPRKQEAKTDMKNKSIDSYFNNKP